MEQLNSVTLRGIIGNARIQTDKPKIKISVKC